MKRAAAPLLSFGSPAEGAPQPPWSSRCRSGRARHLRPSRCVRPPSRHTARGSGHTMHSSHGLAPPMGSSCLQTQQNMNRPTGPLLQWACLMAVWQRPLPPWRPAARPETRRPLWAQTLDKTPQRHAHHTTLELEHQGRSDIIRTHHPTPQPLTPRTSAASLHATTDPRLTHPRHTGSRPRRG